MQLKTTIVALVAGTASAISLSDLNGSLNIGDVTPACSQLFSSELTSCDDIPMCSSSCKSQLVDLAQALSLSCRQSNDPQGLLRVAMTGDLVGTLCKEVGNDPVTETKSILSASSTKAIVFAGSMTAPAGNTLAVQASSTGIVADTSSTSMVMATGAPSTAPTSAPPGGLVYDTSSPQATGATMYNPASVTFQTSATQSHTKATGDANGSLFSTQPESSGAGRFRTSMIVAAVAVCALFAQ